MFIYMFIYMCMCTFSHITNKAITYNGVLAFSRGVIGFYRTGFRPEVSSLERETLSTPYRCYKGRRLITKSHNF